MSRPLGMDSCVVSIRKRCWLAGDCMIEELPSCCPRRSIGHVCCRWQRGIDICRLQQCSSAARSYADNVLSGSSCGVGGASKLGLYWAEASQIHCSVQPGCIGHAWNAVGGHV